MMMQTPRKINSAKVIVAYLDILGYSKLVETNNFANHYYAAIDAAFGRAKDYLSNRPYNLGGLMRKYISLQVMSDAFIVVFNEGAALLEEEGGDSVRKLLLMNFLQFISFFVQDCLRALNCAQEFKCLFRGAIVRGQYYQEKFSNLNEGNFIFSKALCEAYKIEKEVAVVSRVIIDKSVLEELDFSLLNRKSYPDREILRDNDGFYYLNLYCSTFTHTALGSILREMSGVITKGIENNTSNKKILSKYIWFANFHNNFVREVIESNAAIPSFQEIKDAESAMLVEIPK
ncbi:MAG: hypothetical protein KAI72_10440 [Candidatus Pacebacteria bacterium]|nr:hypothetical protein [Candidatus Paceibacterota bacterium]